MADLPIVCSLTPDALEARRQGLLSELLHQSSRDEFLEDGLRLQFNPSSDTMATLARAVESERRCCRFLRFTITFEPDGGAMTLDLTGPPGTRDFMAAMLEL